MVVEPSLRKIVTLALGEKRDGTIRLGRICLTFAI